MELEQFGTVPSSSKSWRNEQSPPISNKLNKLETLPPPHSKESVAFYRDPFNKPEHEHTLRGMELVLFALFYILGVCTIVALFEKVMPVMWWVDEQYFVEQQRRAAIYNGDNNKEKL